MGTPTPKTSDHNNVDPAEWTDEQLHDAIQRLAGLKSSIKLLEADEEMLSAKVMAGVFARPSSFQADGTISYKEYKDFGSVAVQSKETVTIDRGKLVAQGVEIDKIEKATNRTPGKPFVRLYPKKEKE